MLPESVFSSFSNLAYSVHCFKGALNELTVVADWNVSSLLKLKCRVLERVFSIRISENRGTLTIIISFPAAFLNAFVQRTLRGLRFILSEK